MYKIQNSHHIVYYFSVKYSVRIWFAKETYVCFRVWAGPTYYTFWVCFFSDRKCDFGHANILTFHLVYIQGYNIILPNSLRFITIAVSDWCLVRHQVFTVLQRSVKSANFFKLQTKMLQLNFTGQWGVWEATTGGADWHRATLAEISYTIYIYKTTVLPNNGMQYRKLRSTQTLFNRIIYS